MGRFLSLDLSRLPPPPVVEVLDYEVLLAEYKAELVERWPDFDMGSLESDPAVKILEVAAYRETLIRARVNDAARSIMLAQARQGDLDQLGVYFGVGRMTVTPAVGDTPAVLESDMRLRQRIQIAPEAFSVAGPEQAYEFHARSASSLVADVAVISPREGEIRVIILSTVASGIPDSNLIERVSEVFRQTDKVPLTDMWSVAAPDVTDFTIEAELRLYSGPDPAVVKARAEASLITYLAARRRIGLDMPRSGLMAALHVADVDSVDLIAPATDLIATPTTFIRPGARTITIDVI